MGRPSKYTEELFREIVARLSDGEPMAQICRDEHMPSVRTVCDWEDKHDGVSASIARARRLGFDAIAVEALRIANTPCEGEIITDDGEKVTIRKEDMLGHRKLQVETRLKLLAKWDPRRYGERQLVGSDPDNPLPSGVTVVFQKPDDAAASSSS